MRSRLATSALPCLALALCLAAGGPGHAEDVAGPDALRKKKADILFRLKVSRAIDAGAHWVAQQQRRDGSFKLLPDNGHMDGPFPASVHELGRTVLCFYTLADCGYAADHPVVKKALKYVKNNWRSAMKGNYWPRASSYSLSLLVLGLHTLYVQPGTELSEEDRDRYGMRKATDKNPCGYPAWVRALIDTVLDWFMENQADTGLFRYPGDLPQSGGPGREHVVGGPEDLSNSQYVLLALWAGSRCGYEIAPEVLERMALRLLALQDREGPEVSRVPDPEPEARAAPSGAHRYAPPTPKTPQTPRYRDRARGFRYTMNFPETTGAMTAAGMSSLAIVKSMLVERRALKGSLGKQIDQAIWDSIAWLTQNFDLDANPGDGSRWHYYYLYGLERACVIAGKRYLGDHDWYREGAEKLVDAQADDGRWAPGNQLRGFGGPGFVPGLKHEARVYKTDLLDTCFALLFLKRATVVPKLPVLDDGPVTTPSGG